MNKNWRNRPTTIDYIHKNIDYVVGIDESGSSNLKQVLKSKKLGIPAVDSEQHFTVTAAVIPMQNFEQARDDVMGLKQKYWNNALYTYGSVEKRVCFHSREIRGRKGAFNPALIDYDSFINDLSDMMRNIPLTLYASHIDKVRHVNKYAYPMTPYDLCMAFVLERILWDIPNNSSCVVILESRGKDEDLDLLKFIKRVMESGTKYCPPWVFQKIKGVYFNPKWCAMKDDKMSYWELELADLCAYPIQKFFVCGKQDKAFEVLLPKISHYPDYMGKGLKSFP